ncbi:Sigma-70 family RNA polymerase sigma factor [Sulfidibacter corallicola]|uniref:Sigma-70 family RNA polymerase sigma factor n=1 Tax=Sulfidibacter corallicola TaxID=2818388 RepID=A0A8A4TP28_SULCO|nr:ECF-type sigma factor [Sulfidibacter corallicola]QTD50651.1 sigma-70 family RNA polymerase sigma factor [Sulfidibacter corallicola]
MGHECSGDVVTPGAVSLEITALLRRWSSSNQQALNEIIVLVYNELRSMARQYLRHEARNLSIQPTALVHEVYEMLHGRHDLVFENRVHFFRCARLIMRQITIKYARMKQSLKRGGSKAHQTFDDAVHLGQRMLEPEVLLALDRALNQLATMDPRKHRITELRFFLGLKMEEIAEVLEISPRTARREWQTTQCWLVRELKKAV